MNTLFNLFSMSPYFLLHFLYLKMLIGLRLLSCRGYKRFFRRQLLETSDYLKDDCLKINCTVGVVVSAIDCSRLHSIQVPDSDIGAQFGMLLENMEGSDVIFNVAGEKFNAHKLVLAARSPVFRSDFFDGSEGAQEILITDMEPKVFKVRILFILTFLLVTVIEWIIFFVVYWYFALNYFYFLVCWLIK